MAGKNSSSLVETIEAGTRIVLRDKESGSRAFVPIQMDAEIAAEIVKVDGGLIKNLPKGKYICDNLLFTLDNEKCKTKITWLIELKGTKNVEEAEHSIDQLCDSIQYLKDTASYPQCEKYLHKRDFVFAAIAGAPNKTLPAMNNDKIKKLCRELNKAGTKKAQNIFELFCYITPNPKCKAAARKNASAPYKFECHSNHTGYLKIPSALLDMLTI